MRSIDRLLSCLEELQKPARKALKTRLLVLVAISFPVVLSDLPERLD